MPTTMTAVQMLGTINLLQLALPEKRANPVTQIPSMNISKYWLLCEPSGPYPQLLGSWAQEKANSFLSIHFRRRGARGANSIVRRGASALQGLLPPMGGKKRAAAHKAWAVNWEPWVLALNLPLTAMWPVDLFLVYKRWMSTCRLLWRLETV